MRTPMLPRLAWRYLLPGVVPALLIGASLDVANVIMTLSLMSFLGLGLPAPAPELGAMTSRSLPRSIDSQSSNAGS